jgi:hypothetical protein
MLKLCPFQFDVSASFQGGGYSGPSLGRIIRPPGKIRFLDKSGQISGQISGPHPGARFFWSLAVFRGPDICKYPAPEKRLRTRKNVPQDGGRIFGRIFARICPKTGFFRGAGLSAPNLGRNIRPPENWQKHQTETGITLASGLRF